MRQFKFRAWDKENETMTYPKGILFDGRIVNFSCGMLEAFEGYEIMQYTGLKDKNGKEIYEGDIYHAGDPSITYTVVWHDAGLIGKQNGSSSYAGLSHWQDRIEVIGNIYENPSYWKVKNENE